MNVLKARLEDLYIINEYLENMEMTKLDNLSFNFKSRKIYVIKSAKKVIAFISYLVLMENVELEAFYVNVSFRKHGYGNKLLAHMITEALSLNCDSIFLEVRKTNIEAIRLYQKNDFKIVGCRNKYYGLEDGLVMKKELRCKNE